MTEGSKKKTANQAAQRMGLDTQALRIAGLLYLMIIICGLWSELVVRAQIIVSEHSVQTSIAIVENAQLWKMGMAADLVMSLCDAAVAVLLYCVFRSFEPSLALMAMVFRLVQATIIGLNLGALGLALGFSPNSPDLAMAFVKAHALGYDLGLAFFGVSNVLIAALAMRVSFVPRLLAAGLFAAGVVYICGTLLRLLHPEWAHAFTPAYAIPFLAELYFCGWMLLSQAEKQTPITDHSHGSKVQK
jgi:hypothetical protein